MRKEIVGEMNLSLAGRLPQIHLSMVAWMRLTVNLEMRGLLWSAVIATRPRNANPVKNSTQTLMTCIALCVPVIIIDKRFNSGASCKVRSSVAYASEAAECAKVVPRAKTSCRGETPGILYCCSISEDRYCIQGLAADGCFNRGYKISGITIWSIYSTVSDEVDIGA